MRVGLASEAITTELKAFDATFRELDQLLMDELKGVFSKKDSFLASPELEGIFHEKDELMRIWNLFIPDAKACVIYADVRFSDFGPPPLWDFTTRFVTRSLLNKNKWFYVID